MSKNKKLFCVVIALAAVSWVVPLRADDPANKIVSQVWMNLDTSTTISSLTSDPRYPDNPDTTSFLDSWLFPPGSTGGSNWADDYGDREFGWLKPPETGAYTFWIAGDDLCELWLSTDSSPTNAQLIARVDGWTNAMDWDNTTGGSTTVALLKSAPIKLVAGQKYYIMTLHKEAGGGDSVAVAWQGGPITSRTLLSAQYVDTFPQPPQQAFNPSPANGAVDVPRDTTLSWTAGKFAATHDVYLGTVFNDVNSASRTDPRGVLISQGQPAGTFDLEGVTEYGKTYYWRIDEVNAPPSSTIFKGKVWTFTAEPFSYPITGLTATASSSQPSMGPEKTIDGSGMTGDLAGTETTSMWMSTGVLPNWIQYQFDAVYKLDKLLVWNSNQIIEAFIGFGAKDVTIEYSADGVTWTTLANVPQFAQGTGLAGYAANTTVDFGGVMAKYVKLTINKNWASIATQTGLSEVRFLYVPVRAFEPKPAVAATGVSINTDLTWRAGREATSHVVKLGTDPNALAQAGAPTGHSFTPASLNFATTYYWQVNEVGGAGPYPGNVWSFTTQEYATIDNIESYNDDNNRIYDSWIDSLTDPAKGGSQVGYDVSPFAEKTIVHGGLQSMPLKYNNAAAPFVSEAERVFDSPQNWTTNAADTLSLYFRGSMPAFVQLPSGNVLMNAIGTDIWDTTDQFRFAYKTLTGNGTMVARVESIANSNVWAKGGVMIRETIQPGSVHAFMPITAGGAGAGNGASFQGRLITGNASVNADNTGAVVAAPYWVKIERTGNSFTGSISPDGKTWTALGTPQTITMTGPVLIGLALCSHDAAVVTGAEFSNITFTGNVTGNWQVAEIGVAQPAGNSVEGLYVTVKDSAGKSKTVVNPDTAATVRPTWQQWKIALSDFTSAGVKMNAVKSLTIGVGNRASPVKGGTGTLFIDDIGYGHPAAQ